MNGLRRRQGLAVLSIELRKILLGRRAVPMYLFAGLPVLVAVLSVALAQLVAREGIVLGTAETATTFAVVYQFILRGLIYLGSLWVFMNLFRGELLDRSLHYYFLSPIRRELLVASKFLAGWLGTSLLFGGSTLATIAILFTGSQGATGAVDYLLRGAGFAQWTAYAGITVLACLGYGAVFLLVGLFFRNPVVPAVVIFGWELINPFLPSLLKKVSVIFYLESLLPIRLAEGPFALLAEPVSWWLAVPGLIAFTLVLLVIAALRIRQMEIAYGTE